MTPISRRRWLLGVGGVTVGLLAAARLPHPRARGQGMMGQFVVVPA